MANTPITYPAVWWVPEGSRRFNGAKHIGTLTYYGDSNSTLEVFHEPSQGTIFRAYERYDVIWGESARGEIFTLFNAVLVRQENFSKSVFNVNFILVGAHINSLEQPYFDTCVAHFPYLRHWAFDQRIKPEPTDNGTTFHLNMEEREPLVSIGLANGMREYLWGRLTYHTTRFDLSAEQATTFNIEKESTASISDFLALVSEFAQFLSIALFSPQYPSEVKFKRKEQGQYLSLLYKVQPSIDPRFSAVIKFDKLRGKIPSMLIKWHTEHEQVAPIVNYLIRSLRYDTPFDTPDFLIIAHALDGYFKRFVNKKDGKDTRKYKDGIDKLLKHFKDIEILKKCKIDSEVLTQSRDKYSHLLPNDDEKNIKAVEGTDLYWLTQKCKILLTCCILDLLGLTTEEINLCCTQSPLGFIVNSLPFEP